MLTTKCILYIYLSFLTRFGSLKARWNPISVSTSDAHTNSVCLLHHILLLIDRAVKVRGVAKAFSLGGVEANNMARQSYFIFPEKNVQSLKSLKEKTTDNKQLFSALKHDTFAVGKPIALGLLTK